MLNILVVYYHRYTFPMRESIKSHLYSFANYLKNAKNFYLNVAFPIPNYIFHIDFDLLIFHTTFLSRLKWSFIPYKEFIRDYKSLKKIKAVKIIFPQDEFIRSNVICEFINDFEIDVVFTTSGKDEWDKIYPYVDKNRVKFHTVLTGYLDEHTVERVKKLLKNNEKRPIDIGYRVTKVPYSLGYHGYMKEEIAHIFKKHASDNGLKIDISTKEEDIFLGFDWYNFLLRCKYIIGIEGGSSLLDFDGSIRKKVEKYLEKHPEADFHEVKRNCLDNLDGGLKLFAISPRHLESCITKTCQILIEGEYNGILKAWLHYIPVKKDYSNIKEVINLIKEDSLRKEIVERAYKDIVESGKFTYKEFVKKIIKLSLEDRYQKEKKSQKSIVDFYHTMNKVREYIIWKFILIESIFVKILKMVLSPNQIKRLKKLLKKGA